MATISVTLPLQKSNMNLSCAREWLECAQKDGTLPFPSLIFSLQRTVSLFNYNKSRYNEVVVLAKE